MSRDKRTKFVELAQNRMNKTLAQIRLVGNLSNRNNYEFDDEDAKKIVRALQKEVDIVKAKFNDSSAVQTEGFKL